MATLLMAAPDPGPTPPPGQIAAVAPKIPLAKARTNGEKLVCWDEKPVGSHVVKRLCATQEELESNRQEFRQSLDASRSFIPWGKMR
jgi:hypothetical protein